MPATILGERVEMSSLASLTARDDRSGNDQCRAVAVFWRRLGGWTGVRKGSKEEMRGQILADVMAMAALDDFVGAESSNWRARNQATA